MTTRASTIPVYTDALLAALNAASWPDPAPQIADGDFGVEGGDFVVVGDTAAFQGERMWMDLGARTMDEHYQVAVEIVADAGQPTVKEARDRAFAMFDVFQAALREYGGSGSRVSLGVREVIDATVLAALHELGYAEQRGFLCTIHTGVDIRARLAITL